MNSRLKNFGPNLGLILVTTALFVGGCSSDNPTVPLVDSGPPDSGAPASTVNLGAEAHVVPGAATAGADGTEAKPFATIYDVLKAIGSSPWTGTIVIHPGKHELPTDVVTPLGAKITIMAGTTLAYGSLASFHAQGDVKAIGTAENPITMTWLTEGSHWCSFTNFEKTSLDNVFEYVTFEHGYESQFNGLSIRGALGIYHAKARISHCIFQNNDGDDGLTLNLSDSLVEYSQFLNNAGDAIDEGGSHSEIAFSFFQGNKNDGVDLGDGSVAYVHDNVIVKSGDKGISLGEKSGDARIEHNLSVANALGIGIKDGSTPIVVNNVFYGNTVGLAAYEAVGGLGPGKGTFKNNIVWGSVESDLKLAAGYGTTITYNCIQKLTNHTTEEGVPVVTGEGTLSTGSGCDDPGFVNPTLDPATWDFHLKSTAGHWNKTTATFVPDTTTSVLLDKGDPTTDFSKEPAPNGSRVELGMYGGTAEASKTP